MGEYTCTLTEASLKKAKEELHEDPKERLGAVVALRDWLKQQKHIKFMEDTEILLMFLRYAKFSQLKARETIENYCICKTECPTWFDNFDVLSPAFVRFIKEGVYFPLPGRTKDGLKVMVYRAGAFDPAEWKETKADLLRGMYTMFYLISKDENTQVNGVLYFCDMSGMTVAHQTFWTMDDIKKTMKHWQKTFPGRFKGFHYYNLGPIFEAMMAMVMPLMTKKFKDRIVLHGSNMENVYKAFPKAMLPQEYLPDDYTGPTIGSIDQVLDGLLKLAQEPEMARYLMSVSKPEYGADMSKKQDDVPVASFRKLNVD